MDSRWKPSTELPTHLIFYRNKSWVNGVVHTHSIYATAFAALQKEIPVVVATLASGVGEVYRVLHIPNREQKNLQKLH